MRKAYKTALKPLKKLARSADKRGECETAYAYTLAAKVVKNAHISYGKNIREYIGQGNYRSPNKLPISAYEEALRLKERYTLAELAKTLGLTKDGAASRVRRARRLMRTH